MEVGDIPVSYTHLPDEEMERNMVSLEEALEVTDKKSLRTLMLNVIRGDYRNSLAAINLALNLSLIHI